MSYLTRQQAAEHLAVSLRTLDGMIARGTIPAYRIGPKMIRIKDTDLEAYVNRHLVRPEIRTKEDPAPRPCLYVPGMKVV
jgi:excisionase family DNA binding protein